MGIFFCKNTYLTMQKASVVGIFSLVLFSSFMEQTSFAEVYHKNATIEKTQNFFEPLLEITGQKTYSKETIATVNGDAIVLKDLLATYSAGTFNTNVGLPQSVDALQDDFSLVLEELITHKLLCQELERHHILVTDMDVQRAEQEARAPFAVQDELERAKRRQRMLGFSGTEAEKKEALKDIENIDTFSENLLERGLTLAQWRTMLTRQVQKEAFVEQILEPAIHLTPDAIEAASRAYPELMHQGKRVQCRLFSVSSPEIAEQIVQAFHDGDSGQLATISGYIAEDFLMPYDRLPEAWSKVVNRAEKRLKGNSETAQFAEIIQENGEKKVLLVQALLPAHTLSLGEAYARLERLLMEEERALAFTQWREQAWKNADIRVIPQLSLQNRYHNVSEASQEDGGK